MANIKVDDIKIAGVELFLDSESFMNDLGDDEMNIRGGDWSTFTRGCCTVTEDEWSTFSRCCPKEVQEAQMLP